MSTPALILFVELPVCTPSVGVTGEPGVVVVRKVLSAGLSVQEVVVGRDMEDSDTGGVNETVLPVDISDCRVVDAYPVVLLIEVSDIRDVEVYEIVALTVLDCV